MFIINRQSGFTLQEVMISLAILTVLGIAAVPSIQKEMQASLDKDGAATIDQVISSYKQFRSAQRRNPSTLAEMATLGTYQGSGVMPWGNNISLAHLAAPSGDIKGAQFSFQAKDAAQAERLAGLLSKYSPVSAGSLVTLSTPISTIETIEDQMLCRSGQGPADCNVMEVDLDAGSNNITGTGNFTGNIGEMNTVISDVATFGEFQVSEEIVLGTNSISSTGTTISINTPTTSFSGDVSFQGNLLGNNSNITGINTINADNIVVDSATIDLATISNIKGVSLDYESGDFTNVTTESTISTYGEFKVVNSQTVNAQNVVTNSLQSAQGNITDLTATNASGANINLSGVMRLGVLESNTSSLGNASANYLNLTGDAKGLRVIFNTANFNSLTVNGNVVGGDFAGNDFTTNLSSVNTNKNTIDQHTSLISNNASGNTANSALLTSLETEVDKNKRNIALNTSETVSNKALAQDNANKISQNVDAINILERRATTIEAGVASLRNQLETCKSQGGCSW